MQLAINSPIQAKQNNVISDTHASDVIVKFNSGFFFREKDLTGVLSWLLHNPEMLDLINRSRIQQILMCHLETNFSSAREQLNPTAVNLYSLGLNGRLLWTTKYGKYVKVKGKKPWICIKCHQSTMISIYDVLYNNKTCPHC